MVSIKSVATVAIAASTIVLAGCTSSATSEPEPGIETGTSGYVGATTTMTSNGVSYEYPSSWQLTETSGGTETGNVIWNQNLAASATDFAGISAYELNQEVNEANLGEAQDQFADTLNQLAAQANGAVTTPLQPEGTAGFPGLTGQLSVQTPTGQPVDSTIWVFFDGKTEYFINCQYQKAEQTQMLAGCGLIRDTFKVLS
ncbi:MAG: hypothetical protein HQ526_09410 [Actinobacteria bacterium]|nr:hypothetical protein [Actinomycetota bacterium]